MLNSLLARWAPQKYSRGHSILVTLSLIAIVITLFSKQLLSPMISRYAEAVFVLGFVFMVWQHFARLKREPTLWFFALSVILPPLFFMVNYLIDADLAKAYFDWERMPRIMLFMAVGWWLGGVEANNIKFLSIAFLGLLIAVFADPMRMTYIQSIFQGGRVDFGILNAQHIALYFSITLIGFLSYGPEAFKLKNSITKVVALMFICFGLLFSALVIIGTQTRAAWLGLLICLCAWIFLNLSSLLLTKGKTIQKTVFAFIVASLLIAGSFLFKDTITQRATSESEVVQAIISGQFDSIPYTSIGIRLNTWRVALERIQERPLTGWGGRVRVDVIQESEMLPQWVKANFGHFHNTFIEFALGYGWLSVIFIIALYLWLLIGLKNAVSRGFGSEQTIHFTGYSLLLFLVMNQFESYLFFWSGIYATQIMLAPAYSIILASFFNHEQNSPVMNHVSKL